MKCVGVLLVRNVASPLKRGNVAVARKKPASVLVRNKFSKAGRFLKL